jgi:capsular polysaccharide transport system permease protein
VKTLGDTSNLTGLGAFLRTLGVLENTSSFGNILVNYIQSRDITFELEQKFKIKEYYSSKDWDILKRFDPLGIDPSFENFLDYYKKFAVNASIDAKYNMVVIKTRGKDPDYAYELNTRILKLSEAFINDMNKKVYGTALNYFKDRLEDSKIKVREFSKKITGFLNKTGVVSPEQQVGVLLQATAKLQEQLIIKELELSRIQTLAPKNPKIEDLKREIEELKNEINKNMQKITGSPSSIGPMAVELELLKSEMTMLMKELEANLSAYLQAKNQAMMQTLFVETVEFPVKPDAPMEPKSFKNIITIFIISSIIWVIFWFVTSAVREHVE